jgi:multimeric flavodoxin WrbA
MSSVILDGFESENPIGNTLISYFERKDEKFSYFKLKDKNIQPCRSCGACGFKSPGKCIIDDDIHEIMKSIARSSIYIILTPVRFGGYSLQIKKALDRTMPMGIPLYIVKNGHLVHPMRYGDKTLIVIGLIEEKIEGQEENFKLLVENNALNMSFSNHRAHMLKSTDNITEIENELYSIFEGVN